MKYIVILIIILIIFIYYLNTKNKKENFIKITTTSTNKVNSIFNNCGNRAGKVNFDIVKIMGKLNNKPLNQILLDLAFPVGSFYVQFPTSGSNRTSLAFPASNSPAVLFGGDWQDQWQFESVYFRTPGVLANENRVNGFQNYATKRLYGDTTSYQRDYWTHGNWMGNSGVFDSYFIGRIGTDDGGGEDNVNRAYFDTSGYFMSIDVSGYSNSSVLETRVKNRIIKVWKRVERDASGNLPEPLANGYKNSLYDQIYYDGPEQHRYLNTPIPGVTTFEGAMEFCNAKGDDCTHISSVHNIWRYGKNENLIEGNPQGWSGISINAAPNAKVWTKKNLDTLQVVDQGGSKTTATPIIPTVRIS